MSGQYLRDMIAAGYQGRISVLARTDGYLQGVRAYDSIFKLPSDIDVAVSLLPQASALSSLTDIARRGAAFGLVFTAGFAEAGGDGRRSEESMVQRCNAAGMRIIGPNSMGIFSASSNLNLVPYANVPQGSIGLLSQSGNVAITLWEEARSRAIGFSRFVGFGNQADVSLPELVRYLGDDPETAVIAIYLEGLKPSQGPSFLAACQTVSRTKPIVALKGGRTVAGARAAESHTDALSSEARVFEGLFQQAGIVEVQHLEHLLPVTETLLRCPPMTSAEVAVVGSGGGHSTIVSDELERADLAVPEFPIAVQSRIAEFLPAYAPVRNPVDMTGAFTENPDLFRSIADLVLDTVDTLSGVVCYGFWGLWNSGRVTGDNALSYAEVAPLLGGLQRSYGKPIVFYTPYANSTDRAITELRAGGIPCFDSIQTTAVAMAALRMRGKYIARPEHDIHSAGPDAFDLQLVSTVRSGGELTVLDELESMGFLIECGVSTPKFLVADSVLDVPTVAEEIGFPVVIKAIMPGVTHKSRLGAVHTGVSSGHEALHVASQMDARLSGTVTPRSAMRFLVVADLGRPREIIAGVRRDPVFDYLFILGIGGTHTESLDDVAMMVVAPTSVDIQECIERLQSSTYFTEIDLDTGSLAESLTELMSRIRHGMEENREVELVEINPVFPLAEGLVAADASVTVRAISG